MRHTPSRLPSIFRSLTQVAAAVGSALTFGMGPAEAANWTVNTLADDNSGDMATHTGSLRWALSTANTNGEADLITFAPGVSGTLTLAQGQLDISEPVAISGPGAGQLTISANHSSRVFEVLGSAAEVTLSGLTISGGTAPLGAGVLNHTALLTIEEAVISGNTATDSGGGVMSLDGGTLTLRRCTISGNSADPVSGKGGGVHIYDGALTVESCLISDNIAGGGAGLAVGSGCPGCPTVTSLPAPADGSAKQAGRSRRPERSGADLKGWGRGDRRGSVPPASLDPTTMVIRGSIIRDNRATHPGGGLLASMPLGIEHTTLSGNSAGDGGGLAVAGAVHLENCTLSGNRAEFTGGGISTASGASLKLTHATISGNTAAANGGGIYFYYGGATLANSIVADNSVGVDPTLTPNDLDGAPTAGVVTSRYSLIESLDAGLSFTDAGGNLVGNDPELGPLQNNGGMAAIGASGSEGPAFTQMPSPTSVALNAGDPAVDGSNPTTDQRITFPRVSNGRVDMGAVETNPGTVQFAVSSATVNEGGSVNLSVTRSGGSEGDLVVDFASADATATHPGDYPPVSGSIAFPAGDTTPRTITVSANLDMATESDETLQVTLTPRGNLALGTAAGTVTIHNVPPDTVQFTITSVTVNETAGSALLTVRRSGTMGQAVSVDYGTASGTAVAGSDFTALSGTLNWGDGDFADKTISVPIANDGQIEPTESFTLLLSHPQGFAQLGSNDTATVTIGDAPGTVGFVGTLTEARETAGSVTLSVARSGGAGGAASVAYASSNGSALAGSDYTAANGTLTWADGDSAIKTITVPLANDQLAEPTESFTLQLSNPQGGITIGNPDMTVQILDAPGVLRFTLAAVSVDEAAGTVTLTVRRTGGSGGAVSAAWATADGSALAGSDYTAASGTVAWGDGDTADQSVAVPILPDSLLEGAERFTATLSSPQGGATLGDPAVVTVTITDPSHCLTTRQMHPCVGPGPAYPIDIVLPLVARQGELLCRICHGLQVNGNQFAWDSMECATLQCETAPNGR